jgi:hypothetical protein
MTTYNTPVNIDNYTRFMANLFNEHDYVHNSTAFMSFFGNNPGSQTVYSPNAEEIEIDIVRVNGEKRARLVPRGTIARFVGPDNDNPDIEKFTNVARVFPLIQLESDLQSTQLNKRMAGENPYQPMSAQERARLLCLRLHKDHVRRITRAFEYLAAQSILTGTQPVVEGGEVYDFYRNAALTVTVGTPWTGATDPLVDIDAGWDAGRQLGQANLRGMLCGESAWAAFMQNDVITALANNRRLMRVFDSPNMTVPSVFQKYVNGGFTFQARFTTYNGHEFYAFTYNDGYTNTSGTFTKYMPDTKVLLWDPEARTDRYFGPGEQLPMDTARRQLYRDYLGFDPTVIRIPDRVMASTANLDPRMFHFDMYKGGTEQNLTIRSQAAPIYAPTHTDAYYLMEDVVVP